MTIRFLFCVACGTEFAFTEAEQKYYAEKEYSEPKRCPKCRKIRKENRARRNNSHNGNNGSYGEFNNNSGRVYRTKCYSCGTDTVVNYRPSYSNPAFCSGCNQGRYRKRRYNIPMPR